MNKSCLFSISIVALLFNLNSIAYPQIGGWNAPFIKVNDDAPNILWITTDQQRWNTIHALGNEYVHTPNLDRLVAEGVSFTNAHCQSTVCTPSRASFLTGMIRNMLKSGLILFKRVLMLLSGLLIQARND